MQKAYSNADEAYRDGITQLINFASQHLVRKDEAIDAVHDAFAKFIKYQFRRKTTKVQTYILKREIMRSCKKRNRLADLCVALPLDQFNEVDS